MKKVKYNNTRYMMLLVLIAAVPSMSVQYWCFGDGIFLQVTIAIITAWFTEAIILILRKKPVFINLADNSALITAVLLGNLVPPTTPWWLIMLGSFFAISLAKHSYGGLGNNIFNPAIVGYILILVCFPTQITHGLLLYEFQINRLSFLEAIKIIFNKYPLQMVTDNTIQKNLLFFLKNNFYADVMINHILLKKIIYSQLLMTKKWEWININYMIGGLFMITRGVIRWHIPFSILISLSFFSIINYLFNPYMYSTPLIHLFFSTTMLGCFFIATDPVTSPTSNIGCLIYGCIIGLLIWIIRSFSNYYDGLAFSILLANTCVPLIDYYTELYFYDANKD
ncbi:RnfABCDGE type electron transport complex subunit D [Candidatus Ishikawella capsulata]|uniref:Ion-translocating oxidoreductase complex subunit D n=1 Tax=Candidatus Ishikawaella capsulata Mpkobe TaxID=476281 RepID=C5WD79_9ENTR|nr:RnfABCDGE type electron transport complex subunit D [Candidatus Ishikawaella capsulata]BAH83285.1 member of SoxR-reducing complex [Candidatus Ishikawaella capsulata Mpkobe]